MGANSREFLNLRQSQQEQIKSLFNEEDIPVHLKHKPTLEDLDNLFTLDEDDLDDDHVLLDFFPDEY